MKNLILLFLFAALAASACEKEEKYQGRVYVRVFDFPSMWIGDGIKVTLKNNQKKYQIEGKQEMEFTALAPASYDLIVETSNDELITVVENVKVEDLKTTFVSAFARCYFMGRDTVQWDGYLINTADLATSGTVEGKVDITKLIEGGYGNQVTPEVLAKGEVLFITDLMNPLFKASVNEKGEFKFPAVPPGFYRAYVNLGDFSSQDVVNIAVLPGKASIVTFDSFRESGSIYYEPFNNCRHRFSYEWSPHFK